MIKVESLTNKSIRYFACSVFCIWALIYLYLISYQVPPLLDDYLWKMHIEEQNLQQNINTASRLNNHSPELLINYECLCQNKTSVGDFGKAQLYLKKMLVLLHNSDLEDKQNLAEYYLFAGNIYRSFGKFNLAELNYRLCLSCFSEKPTKRQIIPQANALNNIAILYFLSGQEAIDTSQRRKDFSLANNYFGQAKNLIGSTTLDSKDNFCTSKTVEANLKQCLFELRYLN